MSGRDWFLVGTRLIGVWVLYSAFSYVASALSIHFAMRLGHRPDAPEGYPNVYLLDAAVLLCFAIYLLLGASHLANLCYGRDGHRDPAKPAGPATEPPAGIESL